MSYFEHKAGFYANLVREAMHVRHNPACRWDARNDSIRGWIKLVRKYRALSTRPPLEPLLGRWINEGKS